MYSDYALIKKSTLSETADAIRAQKGTTDTIDPANFGSEIRAIESSVVEPILQDKTATENGEVIPDEGYDGLSKVVVNVEQLGSPIVTGIYTGTNDLERGSVNDDGTNFDVDFRLRTKGYIEVEPNYLYKVIYNTSKDILVNVLFYEKNDFATPHIGSIPYSESGVEFTTPDNCKYIRLIFKNALPEDDYAPMSASNDISYFTVNIASTRPAIIDGYTINFFNTDRELIQSHSAKYGYSVDAPTSYVYPWIDSSGKSYTFPLTMDSDSGVSSLSMYPGSGVTIESAIYDYFGIDKSEYNWLVVWGDEVNNILAAYFISATNNPANNYGSTVEEHYMYGSMNKPAIVFTVSGVIVTENVINNIQSLLSDNAVRSETSTLRIVYYPFENYQTYANYHNERIMCDLDKSYMPSE